MIKRVIKLPQVLTKILVFKHRKSMMNISNARDMEKVTLCRTANKSHQEAEA
jgi:hypothetical protein